MFKIKKVFLTLLFILSLCSVFTLSGCNVDDYIKDEKTQEKTQEKTPTKTDEEKTPVKTEEETPLKTPTKEDTKTEVYDMIGQLQPPRVDRTSANYREAYPVLERYPETVTITVAVCENTLESGVRVGTTPQNQTFNQIAMDALNIKLEYILVSNSSLYEQKLNMMLAAGRKPDMFYTTSSDLYLDMLETNQLADLSDVLWYLNDDLQEQYLTYLPEVLPQVMQDSKLYSLPTVTSPYENAQRLYIRQDWLDIVGMEAPTTMEEFLAVGQAFVDNKDLIANATGINPKRVTPFTMSKEISSTGSFSAEGFFNCFGTTMDAYFESSDGKLYYSNTSSEMQNALATLSDMYSRQILDQEFNSNSAEQVQANIKAGYVGMTFGEWWMAQDVLDECIKNSDGASWVAVDLPLAEGVESAAVLSSNYISGYNLVSNTCEHPEAIAKLINLFYDIYYSDDSLERYGDNVLPSNGFYYQFVPFKLWNANATLRSYQRVSEVFDELYNAGFNPIGCLSVSEHQEEGLIQKVSSVLPTDIVVSSDGMNTYVLNRVVLNEINNNPVYLNSFNKLTLSEKAHQFAKAYLYYNAYRNKVDFNSMTTPEKEGWGIYESTISKDGGYAHVSDLLEGIKHAKFNKFYGNPLPEMQEYGDYILVQTNVMFTKYITGELNLNNFEKDYVENVYVNNCGEVIDKKVNIWYNTANINYEYIYALIK